MTTDCSTATGKIVVGKVDVDSNPAAVAQYGVMGIPTFILIVAGNPVARLVGPMGIDEFREKVLSALPGLVLSAPRG